MRASMKIYPMNIFFRAWVQEISEDTKVLPALPIAATKGIQQGVNEVSEATEPVIDAKPVNTTTVEFDSI